MSSQDYAAGALAGEQLPTPGQLDYMAFHGQSERVHSIFKRIPGSDRGRYASRHVLSQVVRGGVATLRATHPEAVAIIQEERDLLEDVIALFVSLCRSEGTFPRELFQALLEWSRELLAASRIAEALEYCDLALDLGARAFPDVYPQILLQKANQFFTSWKIATFSPPT